jgi:hypothetical protein
MAVSEPRKAKTAHVNMMTDTIITNLSTDGLRIIMRSLLATHPEITGTFEAETRKYIQENTLPAAQSQGPNTDLAGLLATQRTIRCMLGCGLCYQSIPLIANLAVQGVMLLLASEGHVVDELYGILASVDGDIVQAITAVQKTLFVASGMRDLSGDEELLLKGLYQSLGDCQVLAQEKKEEFPYGRALCATASLLGSPAPVAASGEATGDITELPLEAPETFELNGRKLPRIFSGLWQLSSPAWGSAPTSKIVAQFSRYVSGGFTAFDMADHYGDAEIIFVSDRLP